MEILNIYNSLYGVIINSGVPLTLFSLLNIAFFEGRFGQITTRLKSVDNMEISFQSIEGTVLLLPVVIFGFVMLPPLGTHLIPGGFLYCYLSIPFFVLFIVSSAFAVNLQDDYSSFFVESEDVENAERNQEVVELVNKYLGTPGKYVLRVLLLAVSRFCFIFLVQTLFNYASFDYVQPFPLSAQGYIGSLTQDFHYRSQTSCYLGKLQSVVNERQMVIFLSFI